MQYYILWLIYYISVGNMAIGSSLAPQKDRRRRSMHRASSEINITALLDVMLVLLIIFMVTYPMLVSGISVDLPETQSAPATGQDEPLVLTLNKRGEIFIFDTKIEKNELCPKLSEITKEKKDTRIFVRGDKNVSYGIMVETIAQIHNAGFSKVALVSKIASDKK